MKTIEGPVSFEGGIYVANHCLGLDFPLVLKDFSCLVSLPALNTYPIPDSSPPWTAHIIEPKWCHEPLKWTIYSAHGEYGDIDWGHESMVEWGTDGNVVGGTSRVLAGRLSFQSSGSRETITREAAEVQRLWIKCWAEIRTWVEVLTLQTLGESSTRVLTQSRLANHLWTDFGDGSEMVEGFSENTMNFGFQTSDITRPGLQRVFTLASSGEVPDQSWVLIKDAYHAFFGGETRRALIDAGSALEISFNSWIEERLSCESENVRKAILGKKNLTLGPKLELMKALGWDKDINLQNVIQWRNSAVHASNSPSMKETEELLGATHRALQAIYSDYQQLIKECTTESEKYDGISAARQAQKQFGETIAVTYLGHELPAD